MGTGREAQSPEAVARVAAAQRSLAARRQAKVEPPERLVYGHLAGRRGKIGAPALRTIEQTIVVLLMSPDEWFVVDEFRGNTHTASAVRQQLWRRGFEVVQRQTSPDHVRVWARWTHEVPTEVGPWEVTL